ncbi:MAG: selenium-dependent xanthine dehydrogenase [Niameybacter sp.]|uniref:selenium-dependent xanthine dehydrogenase n=1 Tax=Niameybacter sp. TaxID=2033640 RepID=UPI002FC982B2
MSTFKVNGQSVTTHKIQPLLNFLRDDLNLTSVKDGCSEGACGSCMVLIDGKPTKACILKTHKLEGKNIITVEGLTPHEQEVYRYAFLEAGAVQCGFCIPAMVISAKGLLDQIPRPTPIQVKQAIKSNICRCTGYKKIEKAILLAADLFQSQAPIPITRENGQVGEAMSRIDAGAKVLGRAEYVNDLKFPGMLFGSALRSTYPRAIINHIDLSAALKVEGVVCILTAKDIPGTPIIGHLKKDWDVMIAEGDTTRYVGDALALVAAKTKESLELAKKAIQVDYTPLPPIINPEEALKPGAPLIHPEGNILQTERLIRGDANQKIQDSAYVVTTHYSTPFTEHAFLEPETAVARPEDEGILIYSGDQGVYQTRNECASMLGLPLEKVRVIGKTVGGGFGGKEDMSVQHHAALLAYHTKCPVKVSLTRAESIRVHPKRHAMEMDFTTACDEKGYLTAMRAVIIADTGAYASLGGPVLQRACTHAAGPYNYQDADIVGHAVYTNNPPAGAFRGFGVSQSCFATECNLNQLAQLVGISPYEIRYRNAIRPGQVLPNGQIADESTALVETLEAVKPTFDASPYAGIACAMKNAGLGVGIPDIGRCKLVIQEEQVHILTSASCIGQGLGTILAQIICETTNLHPQQVIHQSPDTKHTPNSGNTTASRQTLFTGEATRVASLKLATALKSHSLKDLEGEVFEGEYVGNTDKMGTDKENPVSHIAYGYATHVVVLTTEGKLEKVVAAHDIGRAINPKNVEGQIEGGITMSLGYALTEDYPLTDCVPTAKFGTLGLFKAPDTPEIEVHLIEKNPSHLAYGAKGVGEICSIPTAPAVALAYFNLDGQFRTSLPLLHTPYTPKSRKIY